MTKIKTDKKYRVWSHLESDRYVIWTGEKLLDYIRNNKSNYPVTDWEEIIDA